MAFEEAFRIGERTVSAAVIEGVLSRHLDDLEPRLTQHGYSVRSLAEQFSAKPAEIRQFLGGELRAFSGNIVSVWDRMLRWLRRLSRASGNWLGECDLD